MIHPFGFLFFRKNKHHRDIKYLLNQQLLATNEVILAELVPFLQIQNQQGLIKMLKNLQQLPLTINWQNINTCQVECLKNGTSGIGIIDVIIAQNATGNQAIIFSEDKHFGCLQKVLNFSLYTPL